MGAPRGAKPKAGSRRQLAKHSASGSGVAVQPEAELEGPAARAWELVVGDLNQQKIFAPSDALMLTTFCQIYGFAEEARERMAGLSDRLEEADAHLADLNPANYADADEFEKAQSRAEKQADILSTRLKRERVAYMNYVKEMRALASEFAISPVARMRLGMTQMQAASLGALLGDLFKDDQADGEEMSPGITVVEGEVLR